MTTVVDPSGTPIPVYNRSGTTIASIIGNGTTSSAPTPIVAVTGHTIVLVSTQPSDYAVLLPSEADVGDFVEVYMADENATGVAVFAPSGETVNIENGTVFATPNFGVYLRKVSSTNWKSNRSA